MAVVYHVVAVLALLAAAGTLDDSLEETDGNGSQNYSDKETSDVALQDLETELEDLPEETDGCSEDELSDEETSDVPLDPCIDLWSELDDSLNQTDGSRRLDHSDEETSDQTWNLHLDLWCKISDYIIRIENYAERDICSGVDAFSLKSIYDVAFDDCAVHLKKRPEDPRVSTQVD